MCCVESRKDSFTRAFPLKCSFSDHANHSRMYSIKTLCIVVNKLHCYELRHTLNSLDSAAATESIFVTICTHLECKSHFMTWKFYSAVSRRLSRVNHTSATADVTSKIIEKMKLFRGDGKCLPRSFLYTSWYVLQ